MPPQSLSVLIYGSFKPHMLGASYQRAFEARGHRVVPYDSSRASALLARWMQNRTIHRLSIKSLRIRRLAAHKLNQHFLQSCLDHHPNFVFIQSGRFLMPETLSTVRNHGIPVFIFHTDNPFPPFTNSRPESLPCALQSDAYFIWSKILRKRLQESGVPRVEYLPFAWDPQVFPYEEPGHEEAYDLVFVGGWDKEREAFLTPIAHGFKLLIWGPAYWGTRTKWNSPLRRSWQGSSVRGVEAANVLRKARICLNVVRQQNLPDGVIMRTFELPGCGSFALSTYTRGASELIPENESGAYFQTTSDCMDAIDKYLSRPRKRAQMIRNAHALTAAKHQYVDRVDVITSIYHQKFSSQGFL